MSTTPIEAKPRVITPRIGRRNEILAILLLAIGLLLTLCLVSAALSLTIAGLVLPEVRPAVERMRSRVG